MSGAKRVTCTTIATTNTAIICKPSKIWKPESTSNVRFCGLLLVWCWLQVTGFNGGTASASAASDDRRPGYSSSEHDAVEALVRQWAPMVWLAPGELFMPGNVNDFLRNVHAEKSTMAAASQQTADILNVDDMLLYELDREIGQSEEAESQRLAMLSSTPMPPTDGQHHPPDWHHRQPQPVPRSVRMERVIDLPIGRRSLDWFLTANGDVDALLEDSASFLYGQDPNRGNVPVYAVVNMCDSSSADKLSENDIKFHDRIARKSYIPLNIKSDTAQRYRLVRSSKRSVGSTNRRKRDATKSTGEAGSTSKPAKTVALSLGSSFPINASSATATKSPPDTGTPPTDRIPQFHVTYWLFYPYNQGKTICTINLGPLGRLPIPQLFGKCLGTRRDFGSHVGDWEHMTLYFRAGQRREPTEMYVSAHDAGAYYTYERLSGSFEFRRQETRNNHILQQAIFPKTVRTVANGHPVLFSALGSHGLWVAPGRHRFVRVPRLVDVNGFGTPWYTWKNLEFSYDNRHQQQPNRAVRRAAAGGLMEGPKWLRFLGRWGNSQSKCHPLKRLGLNFCEYNDGPTGIPLKEQHFVCER